MPRRPRALLAATLAAATLVPTAALAQDPDGYELSAEVEATADDPPAPDLEIDGGGSGHGVGMSQRGAQSLALDGLDAEEILDNYYTDIEVDDLAPDDPIRVGLERNADQTMLEATEGEVTWQDCGAGGRDEDLEVEDCGEDAGLEAWTQPEGETWEAFPTEEGIEIDGEDAPDDAIAADRLRIDHDGTVVTWDQASFDDPRTYRDGTRELIVGTYQDEPVLDLTQRLDLEDYLDGIDEVPASWAPAALEAQAIAARSYALDFQGRGLRDDCVCHLLQTPANQNYVGYEQELKAGGAWVDAVAATPGEVATHENEPVALFYSAIHNGRSENIADRPADFPTPTTAEAAVHQHVEDDASDDEEVPAPNRDWERNPTNEQIADALEGPPILTDLEITDRTAGGTPTELEVSGRDDDGARTTNETLTAPDDGVIGETLWRLDFDDIDDLPSAQIDEIEVAWRFEDFDSDTHLYAAEFAAAAGITEGVDDAGVRFEPTEPVDRAQMASFLDRTFDLPDGDDEEGRFDDVDGTGTHDDAIHALAASGITEGVGDGDRFGPDDELSRAEMATFLARAPGLDDVEPDGRFDDVDADGAHATHAESTYAIAEAEITEGIDEGEYGPEKEVSRGEMATFLFRVARG